MSKDKGSDDMTEAQRKAMVAKVFKEQSADDAWNERPSKKTAIGRKVEKAVMPKDRGKKK